MMKTDIVSLISKGYHLYKDNWEKVITLFGFVLLINIVLWVIQQIFGFITQISCEVASDPFTVLLFCLGPIPLQMFLGMLGWFASLIFILGALRQIDAVVEKKPLVGWFSAFKSQVLNGVKVILLRTGIAIFALIPLIITVLLSIPAIMALKGNPDVMGILFSGSFLFILLSIIFFIIVSAIIGFLLTFLEVEVAIAGKGIIEAVSSSYTMVLKNIIPVFIFGIIWFLLNIVVSLASMLLACTICLMPFVVAIQPLIVTPIYYFSLVLLWKELGK